MIVPSTSGDVEKELPEAEYLDEHSANADERQGGSDHNRAVVQSENGRHHANTLHQPQHLIATRLADVVHDDLLFISKSLRRFCRCCSGDRLTCLFDTAAAR